MKKILEKFKNKKIQRISIVVVFTVIFLALFLAYFTFSGKVKIEDSLVNGTVINITPNSPGALKKVFVIDGQKVRKGDALALVGSQTLMAYTDGVVVSSNKQIGGMVSVQTPVVSLIDPSSMRIDGTIDENKGLSFVKVGQAVSFTIDAIPGKTFWGYVDEISQTAKQTQVAFSISSERPTQQFDVYVNFDALKYPQIKSGMSSKMTIYTNTN